MVFGETGVGKSTWIHALLNYKENIKIEENVRHLLFDEKEMQKKKMKRSTAKKQKGVVLQMNLFLLIFIQMNILLIKIQLK
jgi:ABC-type phosphate transport system ATPase subunit